MSISLKELKKNRLTPPERRLIELIEGVEPKTLPNGEVQWWKDGMWLFEQDFKNGYLWVRDSYIWKGLRDEFGLNYEESGERLNNILYDYTDKGKLKVA